MSRSSIFLTLLLITHSYAVDHPACSPSATCESGSTLKCKQCDNEVLACPRLGLDVLCDRFVNQTAVNFTNLDLNDNLFFEFSSFPVTTAVTKLLMKNNRLTSKEVTKANMGRFSRLVYLDLSHNKLEKLREDMFDQTELIQEIFLRNTSLQSLPSDLLKKTKALHSIDLRENNITEFPSNIFVPFNRITTLRLSKNPITSLKPEHFINLGNLERLELQETKIQVISQFTFASLPNLQEIDLEHNTDLTDIDEDAFGFYSKLPNKMASALEIVSLRGCNLRSLDQHTFNIRGLKHFGVSKNEWQCDCTIRWMADKSIWHQAAGEDKILEELEKTTCMDLTHYGKSVLTISADESCVVVKQSPQGPRRPGLMAGMTTILLISMMILGLGLVLGVMGFRKFARRPGQPQPGSGHPYRAIYNQGHVQSHEEGLADNRNQKDPFEL